MGVCEHLRQLSLVIELKLMHIYVVCARFGRNRALQWHARLTHWQSGLYYLGQSKLAKQFQVCSLALFEWQISVCSLYCAASEDCHISSAHATVNGVAMQRIPAIRFAKACNISMTSQAIWRHALGPPATRKSLNAVAEFANSHCINVNSLLHDLFR